MEDFEDIEEVTKGLKELIINVGPLLSEASNPEDSEAILQHVEERDDKFHRYTIVRIIRNLIDARLGDQIDKELERDALHPHTAAAGQEIAVNKIAERIVKSTPFRDCLESLKEVVTQSTVELLNNFGSITNDEKHSNFPEYHVLSDGESSFGDSSSLNQSAPFFMSNDQMRRLAVNLDSKKPEEVRHKALLELCHTMFGAELHNFDSWPDIKRGIQECLGSPEESLWKPALKFIAKGFAISSPSCKDFYGTIYATLLEFMSLQFNSSKSPVPKIRLGLDCTKPEIIKLLRCFTLMNEFQQMISHYWLRYQEKLMEDIMDQTLRLLSIHLSNTVSSPSHVTPIHFLALIDYRANWFLRWMHGHYSRAPLLSLLAKNKSIISHAVKSCLEYISRRNLALDMYSEVSAAPMPRSSTVLHYSHEQLEYVYVIHSIHVLGRLVSYQQGRNFFPIKVKDGDAVTLSHLLEMFVRLITEPVAYYSDTQVKTLHGQFEPSILVTDLLRKLCANERVLEETICKDCVTNALLAPISKILDNSQDADVSEQTLLQIADIFAMIAASGTGRLHLLYGESRQRFRKTTSSAAHTIVEFAKKCLTSKSIGNVIISRAVIGNIVYVCRQLYNSCEGLFILNQYNLHTCIADAWREASLEADRASTPTPSLEDRESDRPSQHVLLWEDTLRDNLLNFAATPKGLLLLQQTGALNECVAYMNTRYITKVQVGKCEKFGYGYMLSQVASTAAGMAALKQAGFNNTLIHSVWTALEVVEDQSLHSPQLWPTAAIDKHTRKPFTGLCNLLSAYSAVYEAFAKQPLARHRDYTFRDTPQDLVGLFDRLVYIDDDSKLHSLFNVDQSLIFGLRLVSWMVSCLDTYLLLQTQYKLEELLLRQQHDSKLGDGPVVLDQLVLERNYILFRTHMIGGPSERNIPPRTLEQGDNGAFKWPLVLSYPIPKEYIPNITIKPMLKQDSELTKFLHDTKKTEITEDWLMNCRKMYRKMLTTRPEQGRGNVLQDLVERVIHYFSKQPQESVFPAPDYYGSETAINKCKLDAMCQLGIDLTIRYGIHLKAFSEEKECHNRLEQLMKRTSFYLQQQQKTNQTTDLLYLQTTSCGFDWFTASVFLLMGGDKDKSWKFLHKFSAIISSAYLWPQRLHASQHLPQQLMQSGIPPLYSSTCHCVELVLQIEVPQVFNAFKVSGYCPAQICQHWLRQCFWNYLDWSEICHYLTICILLGIDFQVYILVSIFKYLQPTLLQKAQDKDLMVFLKEEPIRGYKHGHHLEFMQQLETKYRTTVLRDMQNIANP